MLEGFYFVTGKDIYFRISSFWIRIFAIAFGMGVVSGVVMPFQFGTNWSRFSDATANIVSPLLAYEGLTAFSLEAGFLGVLLFGRNLVPRWAHFGAAVLVAVGTLFSSFWILVDQQLDADPGRLPHRRWPLLPGGLDGDHLQSVLSLSPGAHGLRFLCHHRLCRDGGGGLAAAQRPVRRRSQGHAVA